MKGIESLIRLHKWRVDEERRRLVALESVALDFDRRLDALVAELRHESAVASGSIDAALGFGGYASGMRERRERLIQSKEEIEAEIASVRDLVSRAFEELKRYEILAEDGRRRAALKEKRAQQSVLDDVGVDRFRRARSA